MLQIVAEHDTVADHDIGTDMAARADPDVAPDDGTGIDLRACADLGRGIDAGNFVHARRQFRTRVEQMTRQREGQPRLADNEQRHGAGRERREPGAGNNRARLGCIEIGKMLLVAEDADFARLGDVEGGHVMHREFGIGAVRQRGADMLCDDAKGKGAAATKETMICHRGRSSLLRNSIIASSGDRQALRPVGTVSNRFCANISNPPKRLEPGATKRCSVPTGSRAGVRHCDGGLFLPAARERACTRSQNRKASSCFRSTTSR